MFLAATFVGWIGGDSVYLFVVDLLWICCAISCKTNPQQIEQYHDLNVWQIGMATGWLLLLLIASSQSVCSQPTTDDQVCDGQHLDEIKRDVQMLLDNQKQLYHHLGNHHLAKYTLLLQSIQLNFQR